MLWFVILFIARGKFYKVKKRTQRNGEGVESGVSGDGMHAIRSI